MKLVIVEKPSVAQSLSRVIGATKRQDGYLEGGGYLVSWCVGHLVELSAPERYDERFAKWRLEDLPILPERFLYEVSAGTRKQYQILKSLMERSDVTSLVCATDAGREGELIFRLVYTQARCKKPFERLWISSMEDAAIRIKVSEARLAEIATLKKHIINYSKTRSTYEEYRKAGYGKKFFEAHREEITLHKAAKQAFDELGVKKVPKVKDLNEEYARLLSDKKTAYAEYRKLRDKAQELLIAQSNIGSIYDFSDGEFRRQEEKEQKR